MSAVEREYLVADKQQALLDELLGMGVGRQELVEILVEMGQPQPADNEALVRPGGGGGEEALQQDMRA
jgi:hypothetical protein